jgi:hypothetical protein
MIIIMKSGIFMMSIAIRSFLVLLALAAGCAYEEAPPYAPYRPSLGGDYYLQHEACGNETPWPLVDVLVCEEACCIWAQASPSGTFTCEETWCCHAEKCEWFLHYQDCYE